MTWKQRLKRWLVPQPLPRPAPLVPSGLYHYQRERDGRFVRFHLRVEPDGAGLLVAGASEAALLSPAGVAAAKRLLEGEPASAVAADLPCPNAPAVAEQVDRLIAELGEPSGRYPILTPPDPVAGRPGELAAPLEAHLVLGPSEPVDELLAKLWRAGVPHVRFRAGPDVSEPALRDAIEQAEDLGMIAGVRAPAARWADREWTERLAQTGLDYVVLPLAQTHPWAGRWLGRPEAPRLKTLARAIQDAEMAVVAEAPLLQATWDGLEELAAPLAAAGVTHWETFAMVRTEGGAGAARADGDEALEAAELRAAAAAVEDVAERLGVRMVWLPPVARLPQPSLAERLRHGPRAGGDVSIRVEAWGDVIPPRGPNHPAGNLLRDPWERIWASEAFRRRREGAARFVRCDACPGLAACVTSCLADPEHWAIDQPGATQPER